MRDNERIAKLEQILLSYATTTEERTVVAKMSRMSNPEVTVKDYISALYDGLAYGNWPWITYTKITGSDNPIQAIVDNLKGIKK